MDSKGSRKVKVKGYRAEVRALRDLVPLFPKLRRVGSVGYPDRGGADLMQDDNVPEAKPLSVLYTWDSQNRLAMITMTVDDFRRLHGGWIGGTRVQVKARNGTRIGSLLAALIRSGKK